MKISMYDAAVKTGIRMMTSLAVRARPDGCASCSHTRDTVNDICPTKGT